MSAAPIPLRRAPAFAPRFGANGALRQKIGARGRIHLDRDLPFLVLNRADPVERRSLARSVAMISPTYAIWPADPDDEAAIAALEVIVDRQRRLFGRFLLFFVFDLPRHRPVADDAPALPPFHAEIGASAEPSGQAARQALAAAMEEVEIDLRRCRTGHLTGPKLPLPISRLAARHPDCSLVAIGLPRIHEAPRGKGTYPLLFHELTVETFDALLKAACTFMDESGLEPPRHYRALGRSAFVDAALSVDAKLDRICRSFDFLLSISPINTTKAFERFRADKCDKAPDLRYRPLTVDPSLAKRSLYRIDLKAVEDPVLETLFAEKRQEIDQQLTMLEVRNTPRFRFASLVLYEPVESALHNSAVEILGADFGRAAEDRGPVGGREVAAAAEAMVDRYRARDPDFDVAVDLRDDLAAGMMVSGRTLYVSAATEMPAARVEPLLHHEVGVHLLTYVNGAKQGLGIFKRGLAGYEAVQEGLGVFAEWACGGLTRGRLRLLAARVLAVEAMADGAGFVDVFRLLEGDHGFSARTAFLITARVFRGGGLAKDAIYLRGFKAVLDMVAAGEALAPFWYGKFDRRHLPVVLELAERGLIRRPRLVPDFMRGPAVDDRIAAFRARPSFASLL